MSYKEIKNMVSNLECDIEKKVCKIEVDFLSDLNSIRQQLVFLRDKIDEENKEIKEMNFLLLLLLKEFTRFITLIIESLEDQIITDTEFLLIQEEWNLFQELGTKMIKKIKDYKKEE